MGGAVAPRELLVDADGGWVQPVVGVVAIGVLGYDGPEARHDLVDFGGVPCGDGGAHQVSVERFDVRVSDETRLRGPRGGRRIAGIEAELRQLVRSVGDLLSDRELMVDGPGVLAPYDSSVMSFSFQKPRISWTAG